MKKICVTLVVLVLVLVVSSANATIVAMDPTSNTVRLPDGGTDYLASSETATSYRNRSLAEVGGDGWIGWSGVLPYANYGGTAAPSLLTTIGGFDPFESGIDVWVLFSSAFNNDGSVKKNDWVASAIDDGTGGATLTEYSYLAGNATRSQKKMRVESSLYYGLMAGYLGQATADGDGNIYLVADATVGTNPPGLGDRSISHGYAVYEVPEPATMALLGFGGLALLRKRK